MRAGKNTGALASGGVGVGPCAAAEALAAIAAARPGVVPAGAELFQAVHAVLAALCTELALPRSENGGTGGGADNECVSRRRNTSCAAAWTQRPPCCCAASRCAAYLHARPPAYLHTPAPAA